MRTLLATAAVILSITAAQAQEPATRSVPPQSAIDQATQDIVNKLKASGELKRDVKPVEAKQVEAARTEAKPIEAKPIEAKPVEAAKPVETQPVETKAVETKAVETKAVVAKPVEAKATEAKTTETKPVEAKAVETKPAQVVTEAKPETKRVVRKRETSEQTARRLAAKYGVSWDD